MDQIYTDAVSETKQKPREVQVASCGGKTNSCLGHCPVTGKSLRSGYFLPQCTLHCSVTCHWVGREPCDTPYSARTNHPTRGRPPNSKSIEQSALFETTISQNYRNRNDFPSNIVSNWFAFTTSYEKKLGHVGTLNRKSAVYELT